MQGASSDSLHALTEALASSVEGGTDASKIGDDLFGVAAVLRREPGLRRVATDVSVSPEAKAELLGVPAAGERPRRRSTSISADCRGVPG